MERPAIGDGFGDVGDLGGDFCFFGVEGGGAFCAFGFKFCLRFEGKGMNGFEVFGNEDEVFE